MDEQTDMHEFELERRIRHLEREFAQVQIMLGMQATTITEIKDAIYDIREGIKPKPINVPAWVGAGIGVLSAMSACVYLIIAPLQAEVQYAKEHSIETRAYLRDVGDYSKETRARLDAHIEKGE